MTNKVAIDIEHLLQAAKLENMGSKLPSLENVDQKMQVAYEATKKIEDLKMVSKPTNHLIEPIVSPLLQQPVKPSEEQAIGQETAKESQVIEFPHIDFIFGD